MINHTFSGYSPSTNMVFVKGEAEIDSYPVKVGYTLWAKDIDQPVIYIKSIDSAGMITKRIIDCNEREQSSGTQFVTKNDFAEFENRIFSFLQSFTSVKGGDVSE